MNTSKVDPLPHQIEAVYGYVLELPRIRFLIADDPGAGKTIMAGLIIKELKLRHLISRILIVVPGHLKDQWRREMKERFEEGVTIIDRGVMGAFYGENVWSREQQIITSIDFAKRDDVLPTLSSPQFDLIIVDEAHKMAAYRYGDKRYEREEGRMPEDVSSENLGFDLRSTGTDGGKRYIEVKARAGVGAVALTQNEWWKAKRFWEDYFLYVVMNAANDPELIIVRNPAENLKPEELVEMVRYIVSADSILSAGGLG